MRKARFVQCMLCGAVVPAEETHGGLCLICRMLLLGVKERREEARKKQ